MSKIILIDNYDSFVYNIYQYVLEFNNDTTVYRNNKITLPELQELKPDGIIISPGPGTPKDAGISKEVIKSFYKDIPILGVCLGHQCIGEVFGGIVSNAPILMHGKTSEIYHDGSELFQDCPSPFIATRYHSLILLKENFPEDELHVTAHTKDDIIMGIKHNDYPVYGVQFHPESFLTKIGKTLIRNYIKIL